MCHRGILKVFKKQSFILLILLSMSLVVTYQNCGQSEKSNLFGSSCVSADCLVDPNELFVKMDLSLVPGGVFKISANPAADFSNLRLTGTCSTGGFAKTLVKSKIYACNGTTCKTLKNVQSSACSASGTFEIASRVANLTPGSYQLNLEIVGFNDFEQEVYGINSKLPAIPMLAQNTINPPILASFTGTNYWAQDKIYYLPSSSEKVNLDGYITGFCDYNAVSSAGNAISVKLAIKGSSTYTTLNSTTCLPIVTGSIQANSPSRAGRTGYFQLDSFSIYMIYSGGSFVACTVNDYNCINNGLNRMTNRIVSLSLFQRDFTFSYDVFSTRKLVLNYTSETLGKGWLAEALTETLKRLKRSFNFSNTPVSGDLNGTQSGTNDFTQAYRILTSTDEFYDPLVTSGDARYGFGTRAYIIRWLLGATEDISASQYTTNNLYFLGTATTVPYKAIAQGTSCSVNANLLDPIQGVVGAAYSSNQGVERITVCLAHKFLSGLWNRSYADTVRMVQEGVTFVDNNSHCFYRNGGTIPDRDCGEILNFYSYATKMKNRHLPSVAIENATDAQLTYFGNGLTEAYINRIMVNLYWRNTSGDNEYFQALFQTIYPEITDVNLMRKLYPTEYNFVGSSQKFGATRSRQAPDGSYTY